MKLDYTLKTPQERSQLVNEIISSTPPQNLTNKYLEILSNYILAVATDKKDKTILTDNRLTTINKRETSYEGLVNNFESGEDGVYSLFINDKTALLDNKQQITEDDLKEVPGLQDLRNQIAKIEEQEKAATGKQKYLLKKTIIEMRKDQYVLKNLFKQPIQKGISFSRGESRIELDEQITIDENGEIHSCGPLSLFEPDHIACVLRNYDILKIWSKDKLSSDLLFFMKDFDATMKKALQDFPQYLAIIQKKIEGKTSTEIREYLIKTFNITYSTEYISVLWCDKIPSIIAETAKKDYLIWYYTYVEKGTWKRCSRCGQVKLAHSYFFSKNNTSKDHFYSICKECRKKK